jgi:crotonobetainyl-CoA:carnitine CoA-transferase CaiB-like acyl-CoA transferase
MLEDPRVLDAETRSRHVGELYAMVAEIMPTRTTQEWLKLLEENDIPHMPVNELEDLLNDPHLKAIDFIREIDHPSEGRIRTFDVPITFSRTPGGIERPAPRLGEHTREVLMELAGYSADEIDQLSACGAIRVAS